MKIPDSEVLDMVNVSLLFLGGVHCWDRSLAKDPHAVQPGINITSEYHSDRLNRY